VGGLITIITGHFVGNMIVGNMNGLKKRRKNGQNCAFESVSHVIGILRNTSNRQLVDRQMGKGASSGHQLLGVSLVVLWHFDETIFLGLNPITW
jgi:hypothetical protein